MKSSMRIFTIATVLTLMRGVLLAGGPATFVPADPQPGGKLTITYVSMEGAAILKDVESVTAEVMMMRGEELPLFSSVLMKKENAIWSGSLVLEEERARMLLVRFVSGDLVDDNGGNVWTVVLYGKTGQPLEGSHEALGAFFQTSGFADFKHEKDLEAARREFVRELELYPDNWRASTLLWRVMTRLEPGDETTARIKAELETVYGRTQEDEMALVALLPWFDQTGQKERAARLRKVAVGLNPKGEVARSSALSAISAERDNTRRIDLIHSYIAEFQPTGSDLRNMQSRLFSSYRRAKEYDNAAEVISSMEQSDPGMYNAIAWPLIEKAEELEKAVAWAKTGIDLLRDSAVDRKPSYMSEENWKQRQKNQLAAILDTYAFGLFKLGRLDEAEKAYEEAYALVGSDPEMGQHLAECYVRNGKTTEAIALASELVRSGAATEKTLELFKEAYVAANGSADGFADELVEARAYAKEVAKRELKKNRVNAPAKDFALENLEGETVRLADLRGKVVVLDFWATWCGPCKRSFPHLQKVYDAHKGKDDVAIYAVNTWERVKGKEREKAVREFLAENNYTFPVLLDTDVVDQYGVEGIPTRFVIDRKGNIQFKSIGFEGGEKMITEMNLQLEMLLSDDFYTAK